MPNPSIDPLGVAAVERAWIAEALRREADVKAGTSRMVPGAEALERVRTMLG